MNVVCRLREYAGRYTTGGCLRIIDGQEMQEMILRLKGWIGLLNIEYIVGGEELLLHVGQLWEKLNLHHRANSRHFSNRYLNMTFEQRQAVWLEKAKTGQLRIKLVRDQDSKDFVGYCVSTITNKVVGEIESIYLDQLYRKLDIGDYLMRSSLEWLDKKSVIEKRVCVAGGNEQVLTFYSRYGFFPKMLVLEQVPKNNL